MKSIYFFATGCDKHRDEFERMMLSISDHYVKTTNPFKADFVIQSFCAISKECIESIATTMAFLKIVKQENPGCKIFVGGCADSIVDLKKLYPFVDGTFERVERIKQILTLLGESEEKEIPPVRVVNRRAIISISKGCNRHCSFCKVGYLDMTFKSVPMEEVLNRVHQAMKNRARFIVLEGENTTEYGLDLYKEKKLLELLKEILRTEKNIRGILITGIVIEEMSDELIEFIAREPRIHSIQLEIQSLIPKVRKAMNLHGTTEEVLSVLQRLSRKSLISNIMVGHPGETDADFKWQMELVRKHNLFFVMVNPFDNTPGTASYQMEQVPEHVKIKRVKELFKVVAKLREKKIENLAKPQSKLSNLNFTPIRAFIQEVKEDEVIMLPLDFTAVVKVPRSCFDYNPQPYDMHNVRILSMQSVAHGGNQLMVLGGELV